MRILISSNAPWVKTGYGGQTMLFAPRIKQLGHEVAIHAWYGLEGGVLNWAGNIPIYPKAYHPYGLDVLSPHSQHFGADITLTLLDAWVYEPDKFDFDKIRWCPWFPVDSEPLPPPVLDKVRQSYQPIVYSKFAVAMCEQAGLVPAYVPHGVDTKVFKPENKREAREKLKLSQDAFIIGMVAANKGTPSRKAFPQQIEAFARLHKKHPDTILYLHTDRGTTGALQGVHLPKLIESFGLVEGKDVLFSDQYGNYMGFTDERMASLYSSFDVLLLVSMGEGFGVPIVEAQACGTPVIIGDWTAMSELLFGGWKIERQDAEPFWTALNCYQFLPHIGAIQDALEGAYQSRVIWGPRCRAGAEQYDADLITETYWKPVLGQLSERVEINNKFFGGAPADHTHKWGRTGLYIDNKLCVPCLIGKCDAALENGIKVVPGVYPSRVGDIDLDIVDDPDGGVSKFIMRECVESYKLDKLDLKPGDIVVDIGAHVGVVSIYLAKKYGCKVKSYEPVKENYERLVKNIAANGVDDLVQPWNLAVTSDGRDVHILSGDKVNSGRNNIYQSQNGTPIPSVTLNQILRASGYNIDLLKIDCEGAEYEILEGNFDQLAKVKRLVGELHINNLWNSDRMHRLMFEATKAVGVDNTSLAVTAVGDL